MGHSFAGDAPEEFRAGHPPIQHPCLQARLFDILSGMAGLCAVCGAWVPDGDNSHVVCTRPRIPRMPQNPAPVIPVAPPMGPPPPPGLGAALPNPALTRRMSYYDRTRLIANDAVFNAVPLATRQKYDRAAGSWLLHKAAGITACSGRRDNVLVRDFLAMTEAQRLAEIDALWTEILVLVDGNTPRGQMVDPAPNAHVGIAGQASAFRDLGYCFRCDTRAPAAVTVQGFRRLFDMNPPADIQGTLPNRAAAGTGMARRLGMWHDNRDAINEMTICVSRNLKGATKFPSPDTAGVAYIYAIKLAADKLGFDTENWQATQVGGLWRPGEKAFFDIDANNVIAHVQIAKAAAAAPTELHRFQFTANQWTYTANASWADRAVLGPLLVALYNGGAVQAVQRADDFAMGQ
jgi:hypothetical protein